MNSPSRHPVWDFSGQTVMLSAGARGIGRGIVRAFVQTGARVVFGDCDEESARDLLSVGGSIRPTCSRNVMIYAELTSPELTRTGATGAPELGTARKGHRLLDLIVPVLVDALKDFSRWKHPRKHVRATNRDMSHV